MEVVIMEAGVKIEGVKNNIHKRRLLKEKFKLFLLFEKFTKFFFS